jgi:hypothetical protein
MKLSAENRRDALAVDVDVGHPDPPYWYMRGAVK